MCYFWTYESFQAINCTGTNNQNQGNKTPHTPETQKKSRNSALANKTNYTLMWYAFYDLRSGNEAGPILTTPEPALGLCQQHVCAQFTSLHDISLMYSV